MARQAAEDGRIAVRNVRRSARDAMQKLDQIHTRLKSGALQAPPHEPGDQQPAGKPPQINTAVKQQTLITVNERLLAWPSDFTVNPKLVKPLERRRAVVRGHDRGDRRHVRRWRRDLQHPGGGLLIEFQHGQHRPPHHSAGVAAGHCHPTAGPDGGSRLERHVQRGGIRDSAAQLPVASQRIEYRRRHQCELRSHADRSQRHRFHL